MLRGSSLHISLAEGTFIISCFMSPASQNLSIPEGMDCSPPGPVGERWEGNRVERHKTDCSISPQMECWGLEVQAD